MELLKSVILNPVQPGVGLAVAPFWIMDLAYKSKKVKMKRWKKGWKLKLVKTRIIRYKGWKLCEIKEVIDYDEPSTDISQTDEHWNLRL